MRLLIEASAWPTTDTVDGLAAVQSRVAAIESRFSAPTPTPTNRAAAAPSATPWAVPHVQVASAFDAVYRSAIQATAPATPALRLEPGQFGTLEPPPELLVFGNGRIPPAELVGIGHGDHRLHGPAAQAFQQMESAARADGVSFGVIASYRDFPSQQRIAQEKGLYSQGGLAAAPGTSNHGWGLSVDLDLNPAAQEWMRANGPRFGFVEDVPREPWHWTYRPAQ
ncbi:MAG: M15 family metallopeptidase [Acidimicrobiales bacterium]